MYKLNPRETTGDTINFQLFAGRIAIICTNCFKTHVPSGPCVTDEDVAYIVECIMRAIYANDSRLYEE